MKSFLCTLPSTSPITIFYERETSHPSLRRWRCCLAHAIGPLENVSTEVFQTNTLHPLDTYLSKCGGKVPSSYGAFTKIFNSLPSPSPTVPTVTSLPSQVSLPSSASKYAVPSLDDLDGVDMTCGGEGSFEGGETEGKRQRVAK